jgi:hypothetical protein
MKLLVAFFTAASVFSIGNSLSAAGEADEVQAVRDILQKIQRGEEPTQEERIKLANMKNRLAAERGAAERVPAERGGAADRGMSLKSGMIVYGNAGELNVLDTAQFRLADLDLQADKTDDAIAKLKAVFDRSRDSGVKSLAAYSLGVIQMARKNDMAAAKACFYEVTGDLAERARQHVISPLLRDGRTADAVKELEVFLSKTTDAYTKSSILRQIEGILSRAGDARALAEFLKKVPSLITEKEADEAARKEIEKAKSQPDATEPARTLVRGAPLTAPAARVPGRPAAPRAGPGPGGPGPGRDKPGTDDKQPDKVEGGEVF